MHTTPEATMLWSVQDGIARLTFNRPDHANAFGLVNRADMVAAVEGVTAATDARVLLITGRGKFFCAGGDITEFVQHREHLASTIDEVLQFANPLMRKIGALRIPVISAVNGPLGGAGIGYALCADFVLASDTVKLRGGYCALGLTPDVGASYFLTRRVGAARAKEIFMLNRAYDAQACLRLGIVDQVYPAEQLMAEAEKLAQELARGPATSFATVKALCDGAATHDLATHLELEHVGMLRSARTPDLQEGLAAFLEKRAPRFNA